MRSAVKCIGLGFTVLISLSAQAQEQTAEGATSTNAANATATPADASSTAKTEVASAREKTGEIALTDAAMDKMFTDPEPQVHTTRMRPHLMGAYIGVRLMNVAHAGYDPYSRGDTLVQNSVSVAFTPWRTHPFSLYLVGEWNLGVSESNARGADTSLMVNRFALGLEGRWMPASRFYLYAKLVPAAMRMDGRLDDWDLGVQLEATSWAPALDASAGAALRLGSAGKFPKPVASFWLMMDWGYSFAAEADMVYKPIDNEDEPRNYGTVALPPFRPGGFVNRFSFAVTFL